MAGDERDISSSDCVIPQHAVPPEELSRYSPKRDSHSEADIARYVEIEAREESVKHAEKVKDEVVLGEVYEIWDVTTEQGSLVGHHKSGLIFTPSATSRAWITLFPSILA